MGLILRDARLARDINPRDLETDLRTTHRHLLAIEEGQMRLFYSESFFCDLFTRYAVQLGFSAEQARAMRLALSGEGPLVESASTQEEPKPELQPEPEPKPQAAAEVEPGPEEEKAFKLEAQSQSSREPEPPSQANQEPAPEAQSQSSHEPEPSPSADGPPVSTPEPALPQPPSDLKPLPARSSDASQSLGSLWFWGAIAIGLVLAVVILTLETSPKASIPPTVETPKQAVKPKDKETPSVPPESNSASAGPAGAVGAVNTASSPATTEAQQEPVAASPLELPREQRISESILISAPNAPTSVTNASAMAIRFNVKGWIWVRDFDESVKEFVVQSGQTVRFNNLPIFIVVPFPDQLTVTVNNKLVTLRRNDDEKNHARYSRSMLRGLVNNP
jgi:hypothetical protein